MSQVLATRAPGAHRPPGAHQLRHPRELPAAGLQGDAAAGEAAGRDDRVGAAVPPGPRSPEPRSRRSRRPRSPPELIESWMEPSLRGRRASAATRPRSPPGLNKRYTLEAAERLREFDRPTLFAWAPRTASSSFLRRAPRGGDPRRASGADRGRDDVRAARPAASASRS